MKKTAVMLMIISALCGCQDKSALNMRNNDGAAARNDAYADAAITEAYPASSGDTASDDFNPFTDTEAHKLNTALAGDIIEIREKMFIAQTNDIYFNAEDYFGKTIKYEGIFKVYEFPESGAKFYSVIRYGPGCCGVDANAGFEVIWDNGYPEQDDWVEAVGVLEEYEEDGYRYLRLALSSLTVLPARGAEYVNQ